MVRRSEEKAEAELVDRLLDPDRFLLEREAERFENVRGAARRRDGAVPVLRDGGAGCGRDERGGGGDVDRPGAVAARAGRVDEIVTLRVHGENMLPHRLGAARDLVSGLALRAQRDEKAADLRRCRLAVHDLAHHGARVRAGQLLPVEQPRDDCLNHSVRKFRAISRPRGVRTDSGWNCKPWTFNVRCRTAMISPSRAVAQTSSSAGTAPAASE